MKEKIKELLNIAKEEIGDVNENEVIGFLFTVQSKMEKFRLF